MRALCIGLKGGGIHKSLRPIYSNNVVKTTRNIYNDLGLGGTGRLPSRMSYGTVWMRRERLQTPSYA